MYDISSAAKRDSSDMRVIAGVTLNLLPPTFVAASLFSSSFPSAACADECNKTFFSTTFFEWRAPKWSDKMSACVWIYFLVSIPLTVGVVLAWLHTSKKVNKRKAKGLEDRQPQKEESIYSKDGCRRHFHENSHDLGGETEGEVLPSVNGGSVRRAGSRNSAEAIGGAENV